MQLNVGKDTHCLKLDERQSTSYDTGEEEPNDVILMSSQS